MWIYLTEGALSIVAHRDKPDHLLVRSRHPDSIRRAFPDAEQYYIQDADYPYRADILRDDVISFLERRLSLLNYDNFKNTVDDYDYSRLLGDVWHTHFRWGEKHRV
tara:strand:- start:1667 stop:1984 length:318 start_codon:yes stop_codon:yes gene_type:complete